MSKWLVWPLLGVGIVLIFLGATLLGALLSPPLWVCVGVGAVTGSLLYMRRHVRAWRQEIRLRATHYGLSESAGKLTPQLFGEYSPYVIEAAEKLAEERDFTAVPSLLIVLQRCVDEQRPGWRDVAEALVNSLARIGDRRALDLLYRLENVRGIGIIRAIREAIAAIEPQTSLLRAVSGDDSLAESLLRAAHGSPTPENDPALLLRAVKPD